MFRRISFAAIAFGLFIYGCGGSDNPATSEDQIVTVEIRDNLFEPKSIEVAPGTTVRWVRVGNAPDHTVTDNDGAFNSTFPNAGDTFERTFTEQGRTFNYVCTTHASMGMRGSVRVGQSAPPPDPGY